MCLSWPTIPIGWAGAPAPLLPSSLCVGICSPPSGWSLGIPSLPLLSSTAKRTKNKVCEVISEPRQEKKNPNLPSTRCESGLKGEKRQSWELPSTLLKERGCLCPGSGESQVTYRESPAPAVCCCPCSQTQADCSAGIFKILLSAPHSLHRHHFLKAVWQINAHALLPEKEILWFQTLSTPKKESFHNGGK